MIRIYLESSHEAFGFNDWHKILTLMSRPVHVNTEGSVKFKNVSYGYHQRLILSSGKMSDLVIRTIDIFSFISKLRIRATTGFNISYLILNVGLYVKRDGGELHVKFV